jgi:hypothetical protein
MKVVRKFHPPPAFRRPPQALDLNPAPVGIAARLHTGPVALGGATVAFRRGIGGTLAYAVTINRRQA